MESKYAKCSYPKVIPLMSSKEKLKCRKAKTDLRYYQPSPNRDTEKLVNHMPFSFYPFRTEEPLMLTPITGTYFEKFQEPGVLDIINRKRAMMEPFSDAVDEVLLNLQSNLNAFPQQEGDENQE